MAGLCEYNNELSGSLKFWEIRLAEKLSAYLEGLWCMELDTNCTSMFSLRDERSRDHIPVGGEIFLNHQNPPVPIGTDSLPGVKRLGRVVDHPPHLVPR